MDQANTIQEVQMYKQNKWYNSKIIVGTFGRHGLNFFKL